MITMKLKALFMSMLAVAALATGCKDDKEDFGEASLTISPATAEISRDGGVVSVTLNATRDWTATFDENQVAVEPKAGAPSKKAQSVTVTVLPNAGVARDVKVTFKASVETAVLTIAQDGDAPAAEAAGTREDPYTVADVLSKGAETGKWIKGYIVGCVKSGSAAVEDALFPGSGDEVSQTNILIAASPEETAVAACVPVQLPAGAVRTGVNLKDNPSNHKQEVLLYGELATYFKVPGVKNVTYAEVGGKTCGTDPDKPQSTVDYENAPSKTVAEFIAAADNDTYYRLKGKVSGFNATYCSFDLTDDSGKIYVYSVDDKAAFANVKNDGTIEIAAKFLHFVNTNTGAEKDEAVEAHFLSFTEGEETPSTPEVPAEGDGSVSTPYNVTAALGRTDALTTAEKGKYVKGYIVGYINGNAMSGSIFSNAAPEGGEVSATNILIAASVDETDYNKCMPVQLPSGAVRTGINLKDNADNYKKEVLLYGELAKYFSVLGVKAVTYAKIGDSAFGDNPSAPAVDYANAPAKTVAEFIAAADKETFYKLTGKVSGYKSGNYISFDLTDATGTIFVYSVDDQSAFANVKDGGTITLAGKYDQYNGKDEVVKAHFLSFEEGQGSGSGEGGEGQGGSGEGGEGGGSTETTEGEYTSNVEWTLGEKAYTEAATVNGTADVVVLKLGTSSVVGSATIVLPAGTKSVTYYGLSWKGKAATLSVKLGDTEVASQALATNDGLANNSPYTLTVTDSDKYTLDVTALNGGAALAEDTTVTLTTNSSNKRVALFGIKAVK